MIPVIHTEIDIHAPPERVWALLVDLAGYRAWNPFIVSAAGRIELGQRLVCKPVLPGSRRQRVFRPVVNMCRHGRAFSWIGHLIAPGIASGEHIFELEPSAAGSVRLIHRERFGGLLSPLMPRRLVTATREGFELMNVALKHTAEATR